MPTLPTTASEAFARGGGSGMAVANSPITAGESGSRGPHAGIRNSDLSGWERVTVSSGDDLSALVDQHGRETIFRVQGRVPVTGTLDARNGGVAFAPAGGDAALVFRGGFNAGILVGRHNDRASAFVLADLTLDISDAHFESGVIVHHATGEGAFLRDVNVSGRIIGPGHGVSCTTDGSAVVECENLDLSDGSERDAGTDSSADDTAGVIMSGASDGVLRLHGCEINQMPNNGVYASGPTKQGGDGYAVITDHKGHGSDRDQLRVGGESIIDGADLGGHGLREHYDNARGVWSRYARGVTIRDVTFRSHHSDPGEGIRIDSTAGRTTIEDCDIEMRSSHKAARGVCAYAPGPNAGDDHRVVVKNTRIHGDGSPRDAVLIKSRPKTFDNLDVDMPNAGEPIDVR